MNFDRIRLLSTMESHPAWGEELDPPRETRHNDSSCPVDGELEGNGGQAIRPSHLTETGISGESGLSYPTVEGTGQVNGLSYATDGAAEQSNGLSHPNDENTIQTNGFGFPTEEATGEQTHGVALVPSEQASQLTFLELERGTAQTSEVTLAAEVGDGQSNELSRPAEEGAAYAIGLSEPGETTEDADKTSGQANGIRDPTLGGHQLLNGPRQITQAGAGQNNGRNHPSNGIGAETFRLSHPTEESAEQADGLSSPPNGENEQENRDGTNNPIQEASVEHLSQRPAIFGNQAGRLNLPVQETGQPNSHGLLSCSQQISNNQSMNAASCNSEREQATVHQCSVKECRQWSQLLIMSNPQKATRCKGNVQSTYFIFEISEIHQHRQFATPILSQAVFTDTYEWKVGIRLYPNGVDDGWGSHVAVFVHLMKGEYDDLLDWPFPGIITLSVLDQSNDRNHISQVVQAKPNLLAFQKPDDAICRTRCGFVKFAPIEVFFRPQYVKNDKLFLKIEFSA